MSRVRTLSETLLKNPRYVTIDSDRVNTVAEILRSFKLEIPTWNFPPLYPTSDDFEEMCLFYLVFNAINYCYFDHDGKKFRDGNVTGSTLAATRLTENWEDIKLPQFLANVDENYLLSQLFQAENPISLVKERAAALREVGEFINRNVDFTFRKFFQKYKSNAYFVSQAIPTLLSTWRDPFFKRAQLFVGMVHGRFQNLENPPFVNGLEDLTVFADYRVPETLVRMGVVVPSASLMTRIHRREPIYSGSRKELELRAASILGADAVMDVFNEINGENPINSLHMDYLLWSAGRKRDEAPTDLFVQNHITHHYTMTTDY
jgi:hypothetical protein